MVQDDAAQAAAASQLIESRCSADEPGLVSSVVLFELVWVLGRQALLYPRTGTPGA